MKKIIFLTVSIIYGLGLVMIYSTTSADILDTGQEFSYNQPIFRQIIYGFFGLLLGFSVYKIGYRRFLELSPMILGFLTFLLFLILIPGVTREINGAKRWIRIGGFSLQPSEFVKYILPIYVMFRVKAEKFTTIGTKKLLRIMAAISVPLVLILLEPNNGTVGVIGFGFLVLLVLMEIPWRYIGIPFAILAVGGGIFAGKLPYVKARIQVYLHPELDLRGRGHQPFQAKIAAGSGKLLGMGPGHSWQKLSYLPEAQNDYIAAIYGEEFGFIGISFLLLLYLTLLYAGYSIGVNASDVGGFYIAGVVTFLIGFQAFLNLGVVSGLLPSTGLNLPFFSQGGSSLLANGMGIGLLLSVNRPQEHLNRKYNDRGFSSNI
ncbi:MAG: putative peptidoglycan glycosyltransferase FtsW [Waddliaceae bacterium]